MDRVERAGQIQPPRVALADASSSPTVWRLAPPSAPPGRRSGFRPSPRGVPPPPFSCPHPCSAPLGHRRPARVMDKRRRGVHPFITGPSRRDGAGAVSAHNSADSVCHCRVMRGVFENRVRQFYISNKITGLNSFKVRRNVVFRKGSALSLRSE